MKISILTALAIALPISTFADTLLVDTGNVDGRMAMASRPDSAGKIEIEAADDFILNTSVLVNSGTFTGLVPTGYSVSGVTVEIYRVFPADSSNPPSGNVPTRVNSPSDVAFDSRTSGAGLNFTTTLLNNSFTAANSVLNGINKIPNQTTGGEGTVTGQEIQFSFTLTSPFSLPADHYFFIPQVELSNGNFYWLSSVRPIVAPGTPFAPDLQAWIRNENLDPDWLRVGTDIVGGTPAPTFNGAFSLSGVATPEPASVALFGSGMIALGVLLCRRRRSNQARS
ncbi:MAG TPA: PEP-CTERM sorting domain-containing protein [Bryobacteraceae bacterium]